MKIPHDIPIRESTLRDYFAALAPAPTDKKIEFEMEQDRLRNPHNDSYKPKLRTRLEIEWELRYKWADAGLLQRQEERARE